MNHYSFRKSTLAEIPEIWRILQHAIKSRKEDGSDQWQDGYPNCDVVQNDIEKGAGFVLIEDATIIGYCAVLINDEPEYENIEGAWLTNHDFVVFHRVAVANTHLSKGIARRMFNFIEDFAKANNISSIKADTNFDNPAMINLFQKMGYEYCGEVYFRGTPRKAYEKVLADPSTAQP